MVIGKFQKNWRFKMKNKNYSQQILKDVGFSSRNPSQPHL